MKLTDKENSEKPVSKENNQMQPLDRATTTIPHGYKQVGLIRPKPVKVLPNQPSIFIKNKAVSHITNQRQKLLPFGQSKHQNVTNLSSLLAGETECTSRKEESWNWCDDEQELKVEDVAETEESLTSAENDI